MSGPEQFPSGPVLAGHTVLEKLNGGPLASVYLVDGPDGVCALKILNAMHVANIDLVNDFLTEATRLAQMDHPNLVRAGRRGRDANGRPYFTMEYAPRTLRRAMDQGVTVGDALNWLHDVARGLDHLHRLAAMHGDIKPSNIFLLAGPDDTERAKVGDFGLVRAFDVSVTAAGSVPYTPVEILENRSGPLYRAQADIYSLGVVASELLSGALPPLHFRDGGDWCLLLPDEVSVELLRAMDNNPVLRPASATEFTEALRRAARDDAFRAKVIRPSNAASVVDPAPTHLKERQP